MRANQITRPFAQHAPHFFLLERVPTSPTDTRWNTTEQFFYQLAMHRPNVFKRQVRANHTHAAVNVIADSAWGNYSTIAWIRRRHATDREAIAPVNVRHGQTRFLNTRQRGDVGNLLWRLVAANLIDQVFVRVDQAVDAHSRFVRLRNAPLARPDLLQRS